MTPQELDAIRARDKAFRPLDGDGLELMNAVYDRRALLAEVDRLRSFLPGDTLGAWEAGGQQERARIRAGGSCDGWPTPAGRGCLARPRVTTAPPSCASSTGVRHEHDD